MRSTDLWIGKTDDSAIPPRVRLRVYERARGHCQNCTREIRPGDGFQADHVIAIINGGRNSEDNLQCLCEWCHKEKTAVDVAEKSKVYQIRAKHLGLKPKGPSRWPKKGSRPFGR